MLGTAKLVVFEPWISRQQEVAVTSGAALRALALSALQNKASSVAQEAVAVCHKQRVQAGGTCW